MSPIVRVCTLWFLTVVSAFMASVDLYFFLNDVNPGKNFFFLCAWAWVQFRVIKKWGNPEPGAKPKDDDLPPGPPPPAPV